MLDIVFKLIILNKFLIQVNGDVPMDLFVKVLLMLRRMNNDRE